MTHVYPYALIDVTSNDAQTVERLFWQSFEQWRNQCDDPQHAADYAAEIAGDHLNTLMPDDADEDDYRAADAWLDLLVERALSK